MKQFKATVSGNNRPQVQGLASGYYKLVNNRGPGVLQGVELVCCTSLQPDK